MPLPLPPVVIAATPDAGVKEIQPLDFYSQALADEAPKRVKAEDVAGLVKRGAVVIDLRSKEAFALKHVHGAINLPLTEMTDEVVAKLIPKKDTQIVTYCDDQMMPTRRVALTTLGVPSLKRLGYSNVALLEDLWLRPDQGKALKFDEAAQPTKK